MSVLTGALVDFAGPASRPQHVNKLIEEHGNPMIDLRFTRWAASISSRPLLGTA